MSSARSIAGLEADLNAPGVAARRATLEALVDLVRQGAVDLDAEGDTASMHCHSFFSFNGRGLSPTALAWLARRRGIRFIGVVDVDGLDSVDEFFGACDALGLRGTATVETRVVLPEFAGREINSPGEPGVAYVTGVGFASGRTPPAAAAMLAGLRTRATARSRRMFARIARHLEPLAVDYDRDVVSLTAAGNVTERHILLACTTAVSRQIADGPSFWARKLRRDRRELAGLDPFAVHALARRHLMKRGGVGYARPHRASFPSLAEFFTFVTLCGALPCAIWRDGESAGERAGGLLEGFVRRGVVALSVIPGLVLQAADPRHRDRGLRRLHEIAARAQALDLPLIAGTEMNSPEQAVADDLEAPELAPLRDRVLDGARFLYGHTLAQRLLGLGYGSRWATRRFVTRRERNAFYSRLGREAYPGVHPAALRRMIEAQVGSLAPADLGGTVGAGG